MSKIEKVTGEFNFVTDYNDDTVTVLNLLWNKQCEIIDALNKVQRRLDGVVEVGVGDFIEYKKQPEVTISGNGEGLAKPVRDCDCAYCKAYFEKQPEKQEEWRETFTKEELDFIDENLTYGEGTTYNLDMYNNILLKIGKLLREKE